TNPSGTYFRAIEIDGKAYKEHRLAHLYMTGAWPPHLMDHKNGDGVDNRWENIRPATRSQNGANRRIGVNSTTGFKGVSWHHSAWRARIGRDGRRVLIGKFATKEEAAAAYAAAANAMYGEFARVA